MNWDKEIAEIEDYFHLNPTPQGPVQLNKETVIISGPVFLATGLATVKEHNGNDIYRPYLDRLLMFKKYAESVIKTQ